MEIIRRLFSLSSSLKEGARARRLLEDVRREVGESVRDDRLASSVADLREERDYWKEQARLNAEEAREFQSQVRTFRLRGF